MQHRAPIPHGANRQRKIKFDGIRKDHVADGGEVPGAVAQVEPPYAWPWERLILFLFTLIGVGAAAALFLVGSSGQSVGIILLIFAAVCYAVAEVAASRARLYRYGIEEALAVCAIGFLCVGMQIALFSGRHHELQFLVPAAGVVFSLWIWHCFGLWYAFPAAMIFALFVPGYWISSHSAQHVIVALFYAIGLIGVTAVRSRHHFDCGEDDDSLVESFLWLGIYLAINLQLSSLDLRAQWWGGSSRAASELARPFYWTTWVLIWVLPPSRAWSPINLISAGHGIPGTRCFWAYC